MLHSFSHTAWPSLRHATANHKSGRHQTSVSCQFNAVCQRSQAQRNTRKLRILPADCVDCLCDAQNNIICPNSINQSTFVAKLLWLSMTWRFSLSRRYETAVLRVAAPCRLVRVYRRFRGLHCLHRQGDESDVRGKSTEVKRLQARRQPS
jgi:hypothetical protein